jgi:hypothetical protein
LSGVDVPVTLTAWAPSPGALGAIFILSGAELLLNLPQPLLLGLLEPKSIMDGIKAA